MVLRSLSHKLIKMGKTRGFTFTYNVFTETTESFLQELNCRYIVYGYELAPTTGRPHLQGYVYFTNTRAFSGVLKDFSQHGKPTLFEAKGTADQNFDYCSKDGQYYERGVRPASEEDRKASIQETYEKAWQSAAAGRIMDVPATLRTRYYNTYKSVAREYCTPDKLPCITELRPWQQSLANDLSRDPDDRKVIWYVDSVGSKGKTAFALYAEQELGAFSVRSTCAKDVAFMLPPKPTIVLFDLTRSQEEKVSYYLIESIKDGNVFCGKYESQTKRFRKPHVVVFSNWFPDQSQLSQDRWDIRVL